MQQNDRIDRIARKQQALKSHGIKAISKLEHEFWEHDYRIAMIELADTPARYAGLKNRINAVERCQIALTILWALSAITFLGCVFYG